MVKGKGFAFVLVLLLILITSVFYVLNSPAVTSQPEKKPPTPTPYLFPYKNPSITKNRSYRIVIVGDSIVATLGLNANVLRENLISYYPDSEFVTYNYGFPSTNVLSLYDRLKEDILKQGFELIIIESFGYNPLSQYPLAEGLKKQNEELERSVRLILSKKPNAALAFLTPIAPDPVYFAIGSLDLSPEVRRSWVKERIAYIDNHRKFAQGKGIPV